MGNGKVEISATLICEQCEEKVYYKKEEWLKQRHICFLCGKPMDISCNEKAGDKYVYETELVTISELAIGDYIAVNNRYYKIAKIEKAKNDSKDVKICLYNYGMVKVTEQQSELRKIIK